MAGVSSVGCSMLLSGPLSTQGHLRRFRCLDEGNCWWVLPGRVEWGGHISVEWMSQSNRVSPLLFFFFFFSCLCPPMVIIL